MAEGRPIYRVVSPLFWDDPGVRSLDALDQYLALHILTCRQTSGSGLFRFSLATAAEDLAKVPGRLPERFAKVTGRLNWAFHEPSKTLYLPRWWKWNRPDSPNHLRGAMASLVNLPQTPLFNEFASNAEWLADNLHEAFHEACRSLRVRLIAQEQELERDNEQDRDPEQGEGTSPPDGGSPPADGKPPKKKSPYTEDFNTWYAVYPKKIKPAEAFKAWKLAVKRVELDPETTPTDVPEAKAYLLEAVTAFAASGWGQQKKKCPTPANWLINGQFKDDRELWEAWEKDNGRAGTTPGPGQKYDPDAKAKDPNHGKWD